MSWIIQLKPMYKPDSPAPVRYRDLYVRLIAAIAAAFIVTIFGEHKSLFELLTMPLFYLGFLVSLAIALVLISYIYWVTVQLDRRYPWEQQALVRTLLQLLLGLLVPALLDFFQAWLFMRSYDVNILETTYVSHDFQYILLMLAIINIYYFGFYFYLRWRQAEQWTRRLHQEPPANANTSAEVFMVSRGSLSIPLPFDDIAYVFREAEVNFLMTFCGERFFTGRTLDDIAQELDMRFYRINRQMVVHRKAILHFKPAEFGKLYLELSPSFAEPVVVSQKRAKSFREWIKRVSQLTADSIVK